MNGARRILLIHPQGEPIGLPGLAEALIRAGADVEEHFMTADFSTLLDALEGEVLPIVVKSSKSPMPSV